MPDPTRPDPTHIDPTRIEADYLIETAFDPAQAAETMAGEQSSGTFIAVPGETPELSRAVPAGGRLSRPIRIRRPPGLAARPCHAVLAAGNAWALVAEPCGHRGRQPVRVERLLWPAPA